MDGIKTWIRQHKGMAAAIAGGAFLLFSRAGKDGGGGDGGVAEIEEGDGGGGGSYAVGVPIPVGDRAGETDYGEDNTQEIIDALERGIDIGQNGLPQDKGDDDLPPGTNNDGVRLHGKTFRGATHYTLTRTDRQGWVEYLIVFQSGTEKWQWKDGEWMRGHENPLTSKGPQEPPKDDPKKDDGKKDKGEKKTQPVSDGGKKKKPKTVQGPSKRQQRRESEMFKTGERQDRIEENKEQNERLRKGGVTKAERKKIEKNQEANENIRKEREKDRPKVKVVKAKKKKKAA